MSRKTSSISNLIRWKNLRWVSLAASIPAIWACSAHDLEAPKPLPEKQSEVKKEVNSKRELDIIFMMDDSGSMKQEQENLQRNFPKFIKILQDIKGGLPDVHIGVVSSNVGAGNVLIPGNSACSFPGGDRGQFKPPADSGLEDGAKFIRAYNNGTQVNIVGNGTIADTFAKMANLGVNGCGYEHQLQSIRLALYEKYTPVNAGFLRPNAYLAIIIITDEDDCSGSPDTDFYVDGAYPTSEQQASLRCALVGHRCNGSFPMAAPFQTPLSNCVADEAGGGKLIPVAEFVRDILALKPTAPERILVSAIMGWPRGTSVNSTNYAIHRDTTKMPSLLDLEPVCTSATNGSAAPGLRVKQFVDSFKDGIVQSICEDDFGPALEKIAAVIGAKLSVGCITDMLLDTDLDGKNKEFVPECQVSERVLNVVTGIQEEKLISTKCNNTDNPAASTNKPCYGITRDISCVAANGNKLGGWRADVYREGETAPGEKAAANTIQIVKCRTCARTDMNAPEIKEGLCQ
jgi:hypothetical protein